MSVELPPNANKLAGMIFAEGEQPIFQPGGCADSDAIACRTLPHVDPSRRQNRNGGVCHRTRRHQQRTGAVRPERRSQVPLDPDAGDLAGLRWPSLPAR